jgi:tetratricopeptide (TPR) repeat protein
MRPRLLILCAAFWLLASGPSADAAAKWTELRSENFLFIGDASEGDIRRVAERLEQFRSALLSVLQVNTAPAPDPTVVMVFDRDRSMTPVKPLFGGKPIDVAGYFQGGEDANYIAISAEFIELALPTIFHEYAHFLIANIQGEVPVWVGEGLAELYAMTEQEDGGKTVTIGRAPGHHVALLRSTTMLPLKDLVAVGHSASIYNEGNRRSVLYAQSWALVHYLTIGNEARAAQFRKYMVALRSGTPPEQALASAFGEDVKLLDRELADYVRRITFPLIRFRFTEQSASTSIPRGHPLDFDDADAYVADLQGRVRRITEARARVAAIQKRNPNVGRALMVLGAIDLREQRVKEAVAQLEKAAALAPKDFIVQSTYGRSLVTQMSDARNDRAMVAKLLPEARRALAGATALNPNSPRAAYMLAYAELSGGGDAVSAIASLERAVKLDPRRDEYRMLLARALLNQGDHDRAHVLIAGLMGGGRTVATRDEARGLMGQLVNLQNARSARAATPPPLTPPAAAGATTPSSADTIAEENQRLGSRLSGLLFRAVQPGEQRVFGTLDAIDCVNGTVTLRVTSSGRTLALTAKQFTDVDFISYRSTAPGEVKCGPQTRDRVYATYRAVAAGRGVDGAAVAIEIVPDGFVPPKPQQ